MDAAAVQRLERYFQRIGDVLEEESRRGSLALYAMRLLHFAVDSKWRDRDVRRVAAQYALEAMAKREPVEAWIVDDTGFLKQGKHSVGVQRQYTGAGRQSHQLPDN